MKHSSRCYVPILSAVLLWSLMGCGSRSTSSSPNQSVHNEWAWVRGSQSTASVASYGSRGTAAASNTPGARVGPNSWTDTSGNLWLFGGYGLTDTSGGDLNDLWEFNGSNWTWVAGANIPEAIGIYGTQGVAASSNVPGARYLATSWTDAEGNFWLFGGLGMDSTGTRGQLNDLWKYSNGVWTWMSGANTPSATGVYGTKGVAASSNVPGARNDAIGWADASGNLWLFGGGGYDSAGKLGLLNDLWKYSNGEWTWISGANVVDQLGVYGTLGTAAADNAPGARVNGMTWTDASNNLWLFGGGGNDATGEGAGCATPPYICELNDLWKYNGSEWTWMGGSNTTNEAGSYGTLGVAASSNVPGARDSAVGWVDADGNFWVFGGEGLDASGEYGGLNDLWKYNGSEWTWVKGPSTVDQVGVYGTEGVFAADNTPGARNWSASWLDKSGDFWVFGGEGLGATTATNGNEKLNDLWKYKP